MDIEEIKKNAPEGATHYIVLPSHINYFMDDGFNFKWHIANQWVEMVRAMTLIRIGKDIKPL